MRNQVIPVLALLVVGVTMVFQSRVVEPQLAEAPSIRLGELPGYSSEAVPPSESELQTLPSDTIIDKCIYTADDGSWMQVSLIIGGKSKSSLHRPELCLPSQGFQMSDPHTVDVSGVEWRFITATRGGVPSNGFAYTFFNQEGFQTSSHVRRIVRDVWDRSFRSRIDRWVMIAVVTSAVDSFSRSQMLAKLAYLVPNHARSGH